MSPKPIGPLGPLPRVLLTTLIVLCRVFTTGVAALMVYPGLTLLPVIHGVKTNPFCPVWRSVTDSVPVARGAEGRAI